VIAQKDGQELSNKLGLDFFETSAFTNVDVDTPFKHIANTIKVKSK